MEDKLTLHDFPVFLWLIEAVVSVLFTFFLFTPPSKAPLLLFLIAATGVVSLVCTSALTIAADRRTRTLKLDYRALVLHSVKEIPFDSLAGLRIEVNRGTSRSGPTSQIVADLAGGGVIRFHKYASSGYYLKLRRAEQLCTFIGLPAPEDLLNVSPAALLQKVKQQQETMTGPELEIHETDGIRWQVQTTLMMNANPVTRWLSTDFKTPGGFLYLAQKAGGQSSSGDGLLSSIMKKLTKTSLVMYGFTEWDTPGWDGAQPLNLNAEGLESDFASLASSPEARRLLNPQATRPLCDWAVKYPMHQFQTGPIRQLIVLFSPNGLCLAMLGALPPDQVQELSEIGAAMIRAQGGMGVPS